MGLRIKYQSVEATYSKAKRAEVWYSFIGNSLPKSDYDGLKLVVHNPYEVISEHTEGFRAHYDRNLIVFIVPEIIKYDESMAEFEVDE
jgi:hypothetical protein